MRHALLSLSMAYVSLASNLTMRECSCALLQVVHDSDNNLNHVDDDDDDDDEDAGCSALSRRLMSESPFPVSYVIYLLTLPNIKLWPVCTRPAIQSLPRV